MVYSVSIHRCLLHNISMVYPALFFQELVNAWWFYITPIRGYMRLIT